MTLPCCASGRTYLSAGPTFNGSAHATPPPAPDARCRACVADDVYPCRCGHPAHRGACSSCGCRSHQPDRREGRSANHGDRRAAAQSRPKPAAAKPPAPPLTSQQMERLGARPA